MTRQKKEIIDLELTGLNLKNIIETRGLTVKKIMEELSLSSPASVYNWFEGKTSPSVDNLLRLSNILDIPMDALVITQKDDYVFKEDKKYFVTKDELPKECMEKMCYLASRYKIPFHELLEVFQDGFEFSMLAEESYS